MNRAKWQIAKSDFNKVLFILENDFRQFRNTKEAEQNCAYRIVFQTSSGKVIGKQFNNGTFYLEGQDEALFHAISQKLASVGKAATIKSTTASSSGSSASGKQTQLISNSTLNHQKISTAYIGQDESGKGDYFGAPTVAAVYLTSSQIEELNKARICDSKLLDNQQIYKAANFIREIVSENQIATYTCSPQEYNQQYDAFKKLGQGLNHWLGKYHALVLEKVLQHYPDCELTIIDKFGDAKYVRSQLLSTQAKKMKMVLETKAESYTAVACASIIARELFLNQIKHLENEFDCRFPLGASQEVIRAGKKFVSQYGANSLNQVAKLHFKTTESVL